MDLAHRVSALESQHLIFAAHLHHLEKELHAMSANRDALAAVATQLADAYKAVKARNVQLEAEATTLQAQVADLSAEDATLPEITQVMTDALGVTGSTP